MIGDTHSSPKQRPTWSNPPGRKITYNKKKKKGEMKSKRKAVKERGGDKDSKQRLSGQISNVGTGVSDLTPFQIAISKHPLTHTWILLDTYK